MGGETNSPPIKHTALLALERGDDNAADLIARALVDHPNDGPLIIALAASRLHASDPDPFCDLERILQMSPEWIEGHKALCRLRAETRSPNPLESIEGALKKRPKHPKLWMAYLTLLGAAGRHEEAAKHTARLRKTIADLPGLRLVEARHRGFAKQYEAAQALLANLPSDLPELNYERARNALRMGDLKAAACALDIVLQQNSLDIGAWALAQVTWRASKDPRHEWLFPSDNVCAQFGLGFSQAELDELADTLRALHGSRSAPLGQSVQGGTQTHGNLRLRGDPSIKTLFERIDEAICGYVDAWPKMPKGHPLESIQTRPPQITASWSILLAHGGRHVPHLHDSGLISSAAHIAVPNQLLRGEGALEIGLPPEDIPLKIEPMARFEANPGHLVLFPSFAYHSTTRFAKGERLTVAFDAV